MLVDANRILDEGALTTSAAFSTDCYGFIVARSYDVAMARLLRGQTMEIVI
jgi:hypothetical protein